MVQPYNRRNATATTPIMKSRASIQRWSMLPGLVALACCLTLLPQIGTAMDDESADKKSKSTENKKQHTNRLAGETSPYLLLHAHNPVDWYPWGTEAFEKAKKENKPIFLSIGYSSCYWCHVMERLVFVNEEVAAYLNEHFVCIKVDREERPDVDDIYMTSLMVYLQAVGSRQGGGWPLSMFLTPEGKPFLGGTYFPPESEGGRIGFLDLINRVQSAWTKQQPALTRNADILTQQVQRALKPAPNLLKMKLTRRLVDASAEELAETHDPVHGGIDFQPQNEDAPKFPVPAKLALLLYQSQTANGAGDNSENEKQEATKNEAIKKAALHSLSAIAAGGIHDHLGGGFHRYSTDKYWHVPHFEKMLYDQSQLAEVYLEAYQQTKDLVYRQAAEGIFEFVIRQMTDKEGAFYSALDAETDGVEGQHYVWSKDEITKILGEKDAELFGKVYGLDAPKRFEHGYVFHLPQPLVDIAKQLEISPEQLQQQLAPLREKLLAARNQRPQLLVDDKILTSWNGLMIRAFALGHQYLDEPRYLEVAEKAARYILANMRSPEGKLYRTSRGGQAKLNSYLDDYAFFISGLLALHQTTDNPQWLAIARDMTDDQLELFWDEQGKGFYFTSHDHETLIARTKNIHDTVMPSGNSQAVRNLIRLSLRTGDPKYRDYAEQTLKSFASLLDRSPRAMAQMALAVGEFLDTSDAVSSEQTEEVVAEIEFADGEIDGTEPIIIQVAGKPAKKKKRPRRVKSRAFLSADKLPAGEKCRIILFLDGEKGWHINTNPAKPDLFKPTTFNLKSSLGTKLVNVRYPAGKKQIVPGLEEPQHYYEGRISITGDLLIPSSAAGKKEELRLEIRYQACNDTSCERPAIIRLSGRIPVAGNGELVKKINQDLFPPVKQSKRDSDEF